MNILFVVSDLTTEQLGIMSLSSILKQNSHNVGIVEAKPKEIKRKLKKNGFPILAFSAHSFIVSHYLELNRKIKKELNVFSVFGGPHPTYYPEMINEVGVDAICTGEGDYVLLDLINNLAEGKSITDIPNWSVKQDGQIFRNPAGPLIENLDDLPFADRSLFNEDYLNVIYMLTSRGCPYRCSFCAVRGEFRRRSVDNVIEELKKVSLKSKAKFVTFADSTFNLSSAWIFEFSKRYRKEIRLPFSCCVRADLATPESIQCLKEAGCYRMAMGIETYDDFLRNEVLKKNISKKQIICAIDLIKKHNIKLKTFNMVGMPLSRLEDDFETLRFNIRCRPEHAGASQFRLYKNTDVYNYLLGNKEFSRIEKYFKDDCQIIWNTLNSKGHRGQIENLQKIFGITVGFPFLFPFVRFLIKLPLSWFYTFIYILWEKYCYYLCFWKAYSNWRSFCVTLRRCCKIF